MKTVNDGVNSHVVSEAKVPGHDAEDIGARRTRMPASIAHMAIVHKAIRLLQEEGFRELAAFATMLDTPTTSGPYRAYMNLGSISPDLYHCASMARSGRDMLLEGFVEAAGGKGSAAGRNHDTSSSSRISASGWTACLG